MRRTRRAWWLALGAAVALGALGVGTPPTTAQSPCRNVAIRSPVTGEVVSGVVPILGSAQIDRFNFYKLEWAPRSEPEVWRAVSHVKPEPVINGLLDTWNTAVIPDGSHRLKLTVVDEAAVEVCRAVVESVVVGAPTATPTATATSEPRPTRAPSDEGGAAAGESAGNAGAEETAEPTATLVPILPQQDSTYREVADLGMGSVLTAFVGGFCVALLLAAGIVLLGGLRGRP